MESVTDLTDRDCAKIIGGVIGALCRMSENKDETVRDAVRWIANTDEFWVMLKPMGVSGITDQLKQQFGRNGS